MDSRDRQFFAHALRQLPGTVTAERQAELLAVADFLSWLEARMDGTRGANFDQAPPAAEFSAIVEIEQFWTGPRHG